MGIRLIRCLVAFCLACCLPGATVARAQPQEPSTQVSPGSRGPTPQQRIVAQALFEDGRKLMREKRYERACEKFEASNRLDPAMGTQFNLADCYELTQRYASAWILFVDVAAAARRQGERQRAKAARARAAALEPRLTKLRVIVDDPVDGMTITVAGQPVPPEQWGTAVPVEPGGYRVRAQAPGRRPWGRQLSVGGEGETVDVHVPELPLAGDGTADLEPDEQPPAPTTGAQIRLGAAIAMAALTGVAVAVGSGAGIVAISKKSEADEHCPVPGSCYARGIELRNEARRAASVSTVSFAIAGSAAAAALLLWLSADDAAAKVDSEPTAHLLPWGFTEGKNGNQAAGFGVVGRF